MVTGVRTSSAPLLPSNDLRQFENDRSTHSTHNSTHNSGCEPTKSDVPELCSQGFWEVRNGAPFFRQTVAARNVQLLVYHRRRPTCLSGQGLQGRLSETPAAARRTETSPKGVTSDGSTPRVPIWRIVPRRCPAAERPATQWLPISPLTGPKSSVPTPGSSTLASFTWPRSRGR